MHRMTSIAAISVIALAVLMKVALFSHPTGTEAAVASIDQGATGDWSISGQIQEMNGTFWVIQGFSVQVNGDTRVSGVIPTVGTFAAAEGIVQPDTTWLATRIRVSDRNDFSPTPIESTTATATPVGTLPNTPTATATSVDTVPSTPTPTSIPVTATSTAVAPTFTSTRVATATEVSDRGDKRDDGNRSDDSKKDDKGDKSQPPRPNPDNNGKHLGNGNGHGNQDGKGSNGNRDN